MNTRTENNLKIGRSQIAPEAGLSQQLQMHLSREHPFSRTAHLVHLHAVCLPFLYDPIFIQQQADTGWRPCNLILLLVHAEVAPKRVPL